MLLSYEISSFHSGCLALVGVVLFIVSAQNEVRSWGHFLSGGGGCLLLAAGGAAGLTYFLTLSHHGGQGKQQVPFKFNKMMEA